MNNIESNNDNVDTEEPDDSPTPNDNSLELAAASAVKHAETQKTLRLGIICTTIGTGFWIVSNAIVRILELENSSWISLAAMIISLLTGVAVPNTINFLGVHRIRLYMNRHGDRAAVLESLIDSNRTSSNLEKDGKGPHD